MDVVLTAPVSELGGVVAAALERSRAAPGEPRVIINLAIQTPNTLLHDGRAWKRYPPARLITETQAALRAARRADFIVHASYLFLGAAEAGAKVGGALRPIVAAGLAAEELVLNSGVPACVVRLGYRYGPESRSLRQYRRAFRIGRPYWSGPASIKQRHVHSQDAARALLAAARQLPSGTILNAADDRPVSFATFMDEFARLIGNPLPLHILGIARVPARLVVAEEHMQMVELASAKAAGTPRPRGFRPLFADYRVGLRQVVDAWSR
jgi:nucleoside-diphosphate-sugar epimerase